MKSLDIIVNFVQGTLSSDDFEKILYKDKELEELLSGNEVAINPYADEGELYHYLIRKNYRSCTDLWDVQDALNIFLKSKNIFIKESDKYKDQNKILLKVQPSWLDISGDYFNFLLEKFSDKSGKILESYLKKDIKENFKSLKKSPKWLQSPQWPIRDNYPLFFIGQIDVSEMRHDTSYVYVFYDRNKNEYLTLEQQA